MIRAYLHGIVIALCLPAVVFTQSSTGPVSARAKQVHDAANVVDSRDDTTQRLVFDKTFDIGARNTSGNVDIPRMRDGGLDAHFFSIWVPSDVTGANEAMAKVELPTVTWEAIIEHLDHAVKVAGIDHVGLGSDFDGATMPIGMEDASKLPRITEALLKKGYTEKDVTKILGGNMLRVMEAVEREAAKGKKAAFAQPPAFEVISIKAARGGDPRTMRMRVLPNGDLSASSVPVPLLVRYAYDVPINPSPRLSGLPEWRETYDIEAKAPANAVPTGLQESAKRRRMRGMIRGLLADRFKLVMRVEQKTMPVYALAVAKGGPNLQKSPIAERACMFDTGTPDGCHNFIMGRGHPLRARAITMDDLVQYIENWTDLPVVNRTGLEGLFAVETEGWKPMRLPPPPPGNAPAARYDDLPTIFTVLRPLGLELKQETGTVPVYKVEHIERPSTE